MTLDKLICECTAYDFKQMLEEKRPKSWLKSVSAFANMCGGSLFFGISDDGSVFGLNDVQHVCEAISSRIRDYMDPLPDVEMIPHEVDEGHVVLELKVKSGHYTPYYYVGDGQRVAFVRVGDESVSASDEQMMRLVLKGANRTFDSLEMANDKDYSFAYLAQIYEERTGQVWQKKYLRSFGLQTEAGLLTHAGALFADYCPLSQSRLFCTRWNGITKNDALNDAEYKGNILMLMRDAETFVKANTRSGWEKLPNGRKPYMEYAQRAVLEALVNHFIHRDYTVMGGEVHLDIYDDRMVITSPGGMYNGLLIQEMNIDEVSSERRNPVLADVMAQLMYMEKRGSGLGNICRQTARLEYYRHVHKPQFKSTASQFMTTLFNVLYDIESEIGDGKTGDGIGDTQNVTYDITCKILSQLSERQHTILSMARINPQVTAAEMSRTLGVSIRTIRRDLASMQHVLKHEGDKNAGRWKVLVEG